MGKQELTQEQIEHNRKVLEDRFEKQRGIICGSHSGLYFSDEKTLRCAAERMKGVRIMPGRDGTTLERV